MSHCDIKSSLPRKKFCIPVMNLKLLTATSFSFPLFYTGKYSSSICSPDAPRLGGVGLGSGSTGKPHRAVEKCCFMRYEHKTRLWWPCGRTSASSNFDRSTNAVVIHNLQGSGLTSCFQCLVKHGSLIRI